MRLLHVTPSYYPAVRYGGPIVSVHGLCRALAAAGHHVDVYTTNVDGAGVVPVTPGRRVDVDGVGVHYFKVRTPRRWYRSPDLAAALARHVAGYDLVHVHALFLHPVGAAAAAARRAGVPYVLSPRGMLVRELFARRSRWLKEGWLALIGRRVLEQAAAVHVTSDREASDVAQYALRLRRTLLVANGVDAVEPGTGPRDRGSILFLGRLSWKKGLDRVIEALTLLPAIRLVVAGNDDEALTPALRAQATALGVEDRVHFTGPVDADRKRALYAGAGAFVLASRSENFANTVLEAMAAGCPVVLTPEVGLARSVREAGCGVVCDDTARSIASALRTVLDDGPRAAAMGAAGQRLVAERFLWPRVAAEMEAGYRSVLRTPGAAR